MTTHGLGHKFKYELRKSLVSTLARVWGTLRLDPNTLGGIPRLGQELLIGQLRNTRPSEPAQHVQPLTVVFFTMLGSNSYMAATEVALARALRAKGHRVRLVLCDRRLPICENKPAAHPERWEEHCHRCYSFGSSLFDASALPYQRVGDLAQRSLSSEDEDYLARRDFSYTVDSSLFKCFRIGRLRGTPDEQRFRSLIEQSCRITARAALAVAAEGADRVIMSHGVYSSWAPALEVFNARGVPVAVYNKGKRRNSTTMSWTFGLMEPDVSAEWARVKDIPLSTTERSRIMDYLGSRIGHSNDALKYNFGEVEDVDATWRRLELDSTRPTFVLFTNVLWDAASAQREIAFPNAVDWVLDTIDWFRRHPERQLVVKIHPAEVVIGTNQPFASEIAAAFPSLPANVRVIEPQEKVNSWSIGRIATAGIAHTSTPGMELPLEGIPCIVVSRTHYRAKGFTIDVESRDEYFRLLENFDRSQYDDPMRAEYALRYAYLLFERYHLPWDFLTEASYGNYTAFNFRADEELLRHPTVKIIVSAIEELTDFLLPRLDPDGSAHPDKT